MQLKEDAQLQQGKYQIIRVLGQGGFGITYLAENLLLGRKVAIKEFFPKDFCGRNNTSHLTLGTENNRETVSKLKDRFLKEARNIARLDHPGIIRIHDVFEENNTAYYVMDYIEGENLNEMVKRNGPLPEAKAIEYIIKVGEALEYIHSKNMTHFDVKPANIVVRKSDDMPILIDFGLSKQYDARGEATSTLMQAVSHGYSAIELYNMGAIQEFSPQTDVYSLGATLYYLLEGQAPPQASELANKNIIFRKVKSEDYKNVILKCLSLNILERYDSIQSFIASLLIKEDKSSSNKNVDPSLEIKKYLDLAIKGNPDAQFILGLNYFIIKDFNKALEWYLKAANQQYAFAQVSIGDMYFYGDGVTQDYITAVEWYRKSAENGYDRGQYKLAQCYYNGTGLAEDFIKAFEWYQKAAEQGNAQAQNAVANMFYSGKGVEQDYVKAVEWYRKSAGNGYDWGQYNLANMYFNGKGVDQDYSRAVYWYQKAAEQGNAQAQNQLGNRYYSGKGVGKDYAMAVEWYKKSAENGYVFGQYNLADCYYDGEGIEKDYAQAAYWHEKAAEQGHIKSCDRLGDMYYTGKGVKRSLKKAKEYWGTAADKCNEQAKKKAMSRIFRLRHFYGKQFKIFFWIAIIAIFLISFIIIKSDRDERKDNTNPENVELKERSKVKPPKEVIITSDFKSRVTEYEYVEPFSEGLAAVCKNNKWGFINTLGEETIPCKFDFIMPSGFTDSLCVVEVYPNYIVIDMDGNKVDVKNGVYHEGLSTYESNGKYGFIDKAGKIIIPSIYKEVAPFSEGLAAVKNENGKWGFINKSGEMIIPYKYDYVQNGFSQGLAPVRINNQYEYIDKNGLRAFEDSFYMATQFSEGLAMVINKKGETFFINANGDKTLELQLEQDQMLHNFHEELCAVRKNDKWGFINKNGTFVIPCIYDYAMNFSCGVAEVGKDGKQGYVDKNGNDTFN